MDKTKFTINPQLDAEGFTTITGCNSNCRNQELIELCHLSEGLLQCASAHRVLGADVPRSNPKGWQEVDGVVLPSVSPWAQLEQSDLDTVHRIWVKRGGERRAAHARKVW